MGTRGLVGFRIDGHDYLTYNHLDSYPSELGKDILKETKKIMRTQATVKRNIRNLTLVDENVKPPLSLIRKYRKHPSLNVSTQQIDDMYGLLRGIQGTLLPYATGKVKHMMEYGSFIKESLMCEWAYIINFDSGYLEVWKGYQDKKTIGNRYGTTKSDSGYYPCKLIRLYPLTNLPPASEMDALEKLLDGIELKVISKATKIKRVAKPRWIAVRKAVAVKGHKRKKRK